MPNNITISISEPYLTIKEYCARTGTTPRTAKKMVEDGRLPIKPKVLQPGKTKSSSLTEINMVDEFLRALNESRYASVVLKS
ncbi:hypothetical protein [Pectobacterium odoriferum]|uniref:hypothetical protein n=1 Tax=Pectobacterium odoriferum TaxID=78398 RepID=UPI000907C2F7|nr:hypothetical protein [Pectobacterium odoriferum]